MAQFENYTVDDDGYSHTYGDNWVGQTFTVGTVSPNVSHTLTSIKLLLSKNGNPGDVTIVVTATDGAGKPTGPDLSTGTTNGNTLSEGIVGEWREVVMPAYVLAASTKYAIIVKLGGDAANHIHTHSDDSEPAYLGGTKVTTNNAGVAWTVTATSDCMFDVYGTALVTGQFLTGNKYR